MEFECDQGHTIYAPWKALRANIECPTCKALMKPLTEKVVKSKPKGVFRTLALDQASHTTGYAIFDDKQLVTSGVFNAKGKDEIERIIAVRQWLVSILQNWQPDLVGIEGIQFQEEGGGQKMGVTVFETLARLQGVLMVTCYEQKVNFRLCPTNTWRHACGVKGKARADKKRSMQALVKEWYGLNVTDDIADAIGIGYYLCHQVNQFYSVENWE